LLEYNVSLCPTPGNVRRDGFRPVLWYSAASGNGNQDLWFRGSGGLDEPAADGDPGRFGTVLGFQLGEDRADVELDRSFRDKESTCDLGVLQAAGEEREHLEFPGSEAAIRRDFLLTLYALQQPICDGRLEEGPSGLDGADGAEDLLSGSALEQVTAGARA
jgi:hypothetical protein